MSTSASSVHQFQAPVRFIRVIAITMTLLVLAGFSTQFLAGRSTFGARPLVHVHAVVFMGWVAIFLTQALLGSSGRLAMHRRIGMLAICWVPLMVIMGCWITADKAALGTTPFFFRPQHFLIANPISVLFFAMFFTAALRMRRRSDWHMRLQICAMACIMGPAFGRLLPMPLLIPYAYQTAALACMIFPLAGIIRDLLHDGKAHLAWWFGLVAMPVSVLLADLVVYSPIGDAIYGWVTAGHPGAAVPGLEFAPFPPMPHP